MKVREMPVGWTWAPQAIEINMDWDTSAPLPARVTRVLQAVALEEFATFEDVDGESALFRLYHVRLYPGHLIAEARRVDPPTAAER